MLASIPTTCATRAPVGSILRRGSMGPLPASPRARIGDAEIGLKRCPVGLEGCTRPLMHNRAALENDSVIGDAEDLLCVLLYQNGGDALVADDTLDRRQQLVDEDRGQPL